MRQLHRHQGEHTGGDRDQHMRAQPGGPCGDLSFPADGPGQQQGQHQPRECGGIGDRLQGGKQIGERRGKG